MLFRSKNHAIIKGVDTLVGTTVQSTDLRAGAALVVAAIMAKGESEVKNLHHIDRGYEKFTQKLQGLGVNVQRVPYDAKDYEALDNNEVVHSK